MQIFIIITEMNNQFPRVKICIELKIQVNLKNLIDTKQAKHFFLHTFIFISISTDINLKVWRKGVLF